MRGTRWLLLVAIAAILGGIGVTYRAQKNIIARSAAQTAADGGRTECLRGSLRLHQTRHLRKCPIFNVSADSFLQSKDSSHVDLTNVEVKIYNKECTGYDLSRSAAATFFDNDNRLYSEGEAEITLNVPIEGQPDHTPISIETLPASTFDTITGRAETDRPATFTFEHGDGKATGASTTRRATNCMKSDVEVDWKPPTPSP